MMNKANVPSKKRIRVCTKAFETATLMDGLMEIEVDNRKAMRYEHFWGKLPKFVNHLRTWGKASTVKHKNKRSSKMSDRGLVFMFVGYAKDHDGNCYEM